MTRAELDGQIDSVLNDSIPDASLTPSAEGDTIKLVADYVDQEVKTRIVKTTITTAQVLALFDTPITILDSSGDTVKIPINVWIRRNAGTIYDLNGNFQVMHDYGSISNTLNPNPLTSANVGFFTSAMAISLSVADVAKNELYKLKANVGNPANGTGSLDVYVTYIEITL